MKTLNINAHNDKKCNEQKLRDIFFTRYIYLNSKASILVGKHQRHSINIRKKTDTPISVISHTVLDH